MIPPPRDPGAGPVVPQKSHYTLDEMMDQLRHGGGAAGEGGGRRRRRRSQQPVHHARKKRTLLIAGLMFLALLGVGLWMGYGWLSRVRVESDAFRQALGRTISGMTGASVSLDRVRDSGGGTLSAAAVHVVLPEGSAVETADLTDLSATLTRASWVTDEWAVLNLVARGGTIRVNAGRGPLPADSTRLLPTPPGGGRETSSGFRMGITPEPASISVDRGRASRIDFVWSVPGGQDEGLRDMDLNFRPGRDGGWDVSAAGGVLDVRGLPGWEIDGLNVKVRGDALEVTGGRLLLPGGAHATASGKTRLTPDAPLELSVQTGEVPLKPLLPAAWADRIGGTLRIPAAVWTAKGAQRMLEGEFVVRGAVLRGMDFVNRIALALQRREFSLLEFASLRGRFKWTPAGLELTDLSADREGALRLRGTVTLTAAGDLKGDMKLEVSELLLPQLPYQGAPAVFPAPRDGVSVLGFTLGGTAESPTDDIRLPEGGVAARPLQPAETPPGAVPSPNPAAPAAPAPAPLPATTPASPEEAEREFNELIGK